MMNMKKPKLTILCSTYNHKKFIRKTLNSFLSQKTNFEYDIMIYDDASTDGTQEIIKAFQSKYSGKIKAFLSKENAFAKGERRIISKFLLPKVKSEYISICEGDDYFIDNRKLQTQVDFLNSHPDYTICFHPVKVINENKNIPSIILPKNRKENKFTLIELLKHNYIQTNSAIYRRLNYSNVPKTSFLPGDWYLHLYHAKFGKIGFIDKIMAVYQKHRSGIWWESDKNLVKFTNENGYYQLEMYSELLKLFDDNQAYKKIILTNINTLLLRFVEVDKELKKGMIDEAVSRWPSTISQFLTQALKDNEYMYKEIQEFERVNIYQNLMETIDQKNVKIDRLESDVNKLINQLTSFKSSKVYKAWNYYKKIKSIIRK